MKLSSKAHYGLNACYALAQLSPDGKASARELEEALSVSGKYLEQMMRLLSARDIVKALNTIDVRVYDHVIISPEHCFSFNHSGIIQNGEVAELRRAAEIKR